MFKHFTQLTTNIKQWGLDLCLSQVGITNIDPGEDFARFSDWLECGYHGNMQYLEKHRQMRENIANLMPGVKSIISCRLNYHAPNQDNNEGHIASYAFTNDYSKQLNNILLALAKKIVSEIGDFNYRIFAGNGPILEKAIATKAGLGWVGKNSLLINERDGSNFFLGEILTDLELPGNKPAINRCGNCQKCLDSCPTKALLKNYKLDARRCISYLTIENRGQIPIELRPLIKNKIFGCDECQKCCPWNKTAHHNAKDLENLDFAKLPLCELILWDEKTFLAKTTGTVLRRIKHEGWLRNLAVAIGNSNPSENNIIAINKLLSHPSELVREHIAWALEQLYHTNHSPKNSVISIIFEK